MNEDIKKELVEENNPITVKTSSPEKEAKKEKISDSLRNLTISKFDNFTDKEKVIYNEPKPIPGAAPFISVFFLIVYTYITVIITVISSIVVSIYIMYIYSTSKFDFSNLFLILFYFSVFFVLLNSFYFFVYGNRLPGLNHRIQFFCEGLMNFGNLAVFLGFYLYFQNLIGIPLLYLFVSFDLALAFVVSYFTFKFNIKLIQKPSSNFWTDLQIFFIIGKLADNNGKDWTSTLIIFWILAYFLLFFALICALVFLTFFISILLGRNILNHWALSIGLTIFMSIIVFYCCIYYYILLGFQNLLEKDLIVPLGKSGGKHDKLLYNSMYYFAILSSIVLFLMLVYTIIFYSLVKQYMNQNTSNLEISMTSFVKNLRVNMTQSSQNYFQKQKEGEEIKEPIKLDTCYVCMDKMSDTLIRPCSHSGVCQECVKTLLKKEIYDCPMCKKRMKEIFLIFFDEERKEYLSNGVIKFK